MVDEIIIKKNVVKIHLQLLLVRRGLRPLTILRTHVPD